jgi:hypothetical protein
MTAAAIIGSTTITAVWVGLGGDPSVHHRARAFYRDGDNPQTVLLNDAKGCWYDFRDNIGGGILDLIQRVLGCDRSTALRWLADFTGLQLDEQPFAAKARRQYARRCARAQQLAREVGDFEHGLALYLERRLKNAAALTAWLLNLGVDDLSGLWADPTRDITTLRQADVDCLVQTYRNLAESVRRPFRDAGRSDREHAEAITHTIVALLASAPPIKEVPYE